MAEFAHERLQPSRLDSQDEKDATAIDIAGMYLKKAALALAKELLSSPLIHNEDDQIARVEIVLRAARHMRRKSEHHGDLIPSMRQADGSMIPLITRLIDLMGRDRVILAEEWNDHRSKSKANRAIREAREEIETVAQQVIREGEIVA